MRKTISIALVCALLGACSSGTDEIEEVAGENKAPHAPTLSAPENNLFCMTNELQFSWLPATDPEGDKVSYIFEISTVPDFSGPSRTELSSLSLNKKVTKGQNYYWRVMTKDEHGNHSSFSETRNFYTEDTQTTNSLPTVPKLISPEEDSTQGAQVTLSWESTDSDDGQLQFDLYFGTSESPALLEENLQESSYVVNALVSGKTYYWKVVAKDASGGKTNGQLWSFNTK